MKNNNNRNNNNMYTTPLVGLVEVEEEKERTKN